MRVNVRKANMNFTFNLSFVKCSILLEDKYIDKISNKLSIRFETVVV